MCSKANLEQQEDIALFLIVQHINSKAGVSNDKLVKTLERKQTDIALDVTDNRLLLRIIIR